MLRSRKSKLASLTTWRKKKTNSLFSKGFKSISQIQTTTISGPSKNVSVISMILRKILNGGYMFTISITVLKMSTQLKTKKKKRAGMLADFPTRTRSVVCRRWLRKFALQCCSYSKRLQVRFFCPEQCPFQDHQQETYGGIYTITQKSASHLLF